MRASNDSGTVESVVGVAVMAIAVTVVVGLLVPAARAAVRRQALADTHEIARAYTIPVVAGADCAWFFSSPGLHTDRAGAPLVLAPECLPSRLTGIGGEPVRIEEHPDGPQHPPVGGRDTAQRFVVNDDWDIEIRDYYRAVGGDGSLGCGEHMGGTPRDYYSDGPLLAVREVTVDWLHGNLRRRVEAAAAPATAVVWRSIHDNRPVSDPHADGDPWRQISPADSRQQQLSDRDLPQAPIPPFGGWRAGTAEPTALPQAGGCRIAVIDS